MPTISLKEIALASQDFTSTSSDGRNVGNVVRGVIFGVPLGIAAVVYVLVALPKNKKRDDELFGAWLGTLAGGLLLAVVVAAVLMSSSSGATTDAASRPGAQADRVVGVLRRCTAKYEFSAPGASPRERSGDDCIPRVYTPVTGAYRIAGQSTTYSPQNIRLEVTVRTAAATTYTVEVSADTQVAIGDAWPPSR